MRLARITVDVLLSDAFDGMDLLDVRVESVKVTGVSDEELTSIIDYTVDQAEFVVTDGTEDD